MAPTKRRNGFAIFKIILLLVCTLLLIAAIWAIFLLESPETDLFAPLPTHAPAAPPEAPTDTSPGLLDKLWTALRPARPDSGPREIDVTSFGVDVARYQGTIDWAQAAADGVEFAMVRVGYRTLEDGAITADPNGKYNLQEASRQGIKLGAYFFSTAVTRAEAVEEARWVADFIAQYPITYPVAYNCEGFDQPGNRQHGLSVTERTDIALVFLKTMEELGYEAMFYASKNELEGDAKWEVSRIDPEYKIWVAQYPEVPYPETARSAYTGVHHMWQYTRTGTVAGCETEIDLDVAYFSYDGIAAPKDGTPPQAVLPDAEAMMEFEPVSDTVTAKNETNLRDIPSQGEEATVVYTLQNGERIRRTGISDSGWSRLEKDGQILYAVSSYLTTGEEPEPEPGIQTEFEEIRDQVTAKDVVNLRKLPSVTETEAEVVAQLKNGEVVTRTGINRELGWSRVEYDGQTLYCVSSYLKSAE